VSQPELERRFDRREIGRRCRTKKKNSVNDNDIVFSMLLHIKSAREKQKNNNLQLCKAANLFLFLFLFIFFKLSTFVEEEGKERKTLKD
jgi:hypothetical protein